MKELKYTIQLLKAFEIDGYIFELFYKNDIVETFISKDEYGTKLFCIGLPVGLNNNTISETVDIAINDIVANKDIYINDYIEVIEDWKERTRKVKCYK